MLLSVRSHVRRLCAVSTMACTDYRYLVVSYPKPEASPPQTHIDNHLNMQEINLVLKNLVKTGHLNNARQLFDKMLQRDEISWTTIISGYVNGMNTTEALSLFSKMWVEPGLHMDPFILSLALKGCGLNMSVSFGESLHGYSVKTDFVNSVFVGSALVDMYMKIGKVEEGCFVFKDMPLRNVVSWTAIIAGLVRAGYNKKALAYFSDMWIQRVGCDTYTFSSALKACADSGALNYGREIHCQTLKKGFIAVSFVANTLATMYNKCGKLDYGLRLFESMTQRDVVSWTTIIMSNVQIGQEENAVKAFRRMRETDVSPNEFTFAAVISGCAALGRIEWGEQLHAHVIRLGLVDSLSVANSIMAMYSKCWQLDLASTVFQGLSRRDIISWSTMISGYAQGGCGEEAFDYLSWMRREGPRPNEFAFASVLSVCGNMAILEQGKQLHAHVLCVGLEQNTMVQSALINMYSKCGSIKEASKIFDEAEYNNIVSWTAMINGYAEHGYSQEAIDLFKKLPKVGLRPDSVTFIAVLAACSHAGLVDLGFHYFNSLSKVHQICPSKDHYGCMIDLLCRAGRLNDAESMIQSMPFQRDDVVWSTLLRACRIHGDVDCGKRAAEKILQLDPNCAVTHITLANMYSAKGKWKEAAEVRKMMKSKGVVKEPGWSWIKVKDRVSAFVSGDRSHPEGEYIYDVLDLLASQAEMRIQEIDFLLAVQESQR
ncbi:PREDICTED: putative pentatricopeptide repeat-containing protein At3g47840 [Populus euphratica]|uniref:Pentatricopeptide repeat-containing protein At3g47840 n=1 Tax=Populus euphratica TaxID=75702 RepID=A0AAJ6U9J0_POPEU|nr:PREDICTED: putative pentatricopeptide repeat-containing protein At3g47840 [Populus euphratica]